MHRAPHLKIPASLALDDESAAKLRAFEAGLDPAAPEAGGRVRVLGYGEVSAALLINSLPDRACKRMAGFADHEAVARYVQAVGDYLAELRAHGVALAETRLAVLEGVDGLPRVYLVQPLLAPGGLAANLLREAEDTRFLECVRAILAVVRGVLQSNATRHDGRAVTVDAQLSNWWFATEKDAPPVLIDVGTPFMRRHGVDECGTEFLLAPVPGFLRWYYRRQRAVERYIDDYFSPRLLALDLLGNFHKEGRPDRIDTALPTVNDWVASFDGEAHITAGEVAAYYKSDAAELALYLRIRRLDRWIHRYLRGRPYPFVLPGAVRR